MGYNYRIMTKQKPNGEISNLIIAYEFALGLIEVVIGFGVAIFGNRVIQAYQSLRDTDILGEQHDLLVDALQKIVPYVSAHKFYIIVLLSALGLVKIISSIGLWMGKEWGKHLLIGLLVVLIPFDLAGIIIHMTLLDLAYLIIDVLIILYMTGFKPHHYFLEIKNFLNNKN